MSDESLTPNEFLRLNKSEIEDIFEESLPPSKGKAYFEPGLYDKITNPTLTTVKKWKAASTAKAEERKAILNWIIPFLFIGPGLISIIVAGGWSKPTSFIMTGGAVLIISYLWFFGRIWAWEAKRYANNVTYAESALTKTLNGRAREWAEERYDLNTDYIEWSASSNFYIEGMGYRWKELPENGHFRIFEVETGIEAPLLKDM